MSEVASVVFLVDVLVTHDVSELLSLEVPR